MTSKLKQHIVIGLAGIHGVGKSTIAEQLELILAAHDFFVDVISIGGNLALELANATGGDEKKIQHLKNTNPLTRWLLEKMGCEYFKPEDLYKNISDYISNITMPSIIFVDGIRRPSDEMFIHEKHKGIVILINRDISSRHDKLDYPDKLALLPSEVDIGKVRADYVFSNDSQNLVRLRYDIRHLIFNEIFNRSDIKSLIL